jgi:hypothetical protein
MPSDIFTVKYCKDSTTAKWLGFKVEGYEASSSLQFEKLMSKLR